MILTKEGKKLTPNYNTFISRYQSIIGQTDISINITRSLTRLKSVFVSFWTDYAADPRDSLVTLKKWNDFFSPTAPETINSVNTYNIDGKFQCQFPDRVVIRISRIPDEQSSGILLPIASNVRASIVNDPQFYYNKGYAYKSIQILRRD